MRALLTDAKGEVTRLRTSLNEVEEEMTRLKGSLTKVEEKVSLIEHRVSEAAVKAIEVFGREKTFTKNC